MFSCCCVLSLQVKLCAREDLAVEAADAAEVEVHRICFGFGLFVLIVLRKVSGGDKDNV